MKTISIAVLLSVAVTFSSAEDDGQYHPEVIGGDDGKYHSQKQGLYRAVDDGRYQSLEQANGKYASIYAGFDPTYVQALPRELLAPYVQYGDGVDLDPYASSVSAVTYSPITTTYRPIVYSNPRTAYSTTIRPPVYSTTLRPAVYSTSQPTISVKTIYNSDAAANIIRQDSEADKDGYHYAYQSDNGIAAEEQGVVNSSGSGGTRVRGFYEYVGPDGVTYRVDYTADENGFRPFGRHLPVAK